MRRKVELLSLSALFVSALALPREVNAQELTASWAQRQSWPMRFLFYSGTLGFAPGLAHYGGSVGTQLHHKRWGRHELIQPVELGYVQQAYFGEGLHADTGLLYRYCMGFGLCVDGGLVGGLERLKPVDEVYTLTAGGFERGPGSADMTARLGVSASLGYTTCALGPQPVQLFVSYRQLALLSFLPDQGLPLFGRTQLGVGLSIPLTSTAEHFEEKGASCSTGR